MRCLDLKAVILSHLVRQTLHNIVRYFLLDTTATTHKVMVRMGGCDFIVGFIVPWLGGYDQTKFDEQVESSIECRTLDRCVHRTHPRVNFSWRRVFPAIAHCIQNDDTLPPAPTPSLNAL